MARIINIKCVCNVGAIPTPSRIQTTGGTLLDGLGEGDAALAALEQSVALHRSIDDTGEEYASVLLDLALTLLLNGPERQRARGLFREALRLYWARHIIAGCVTSLRGIALVAWAEGAFEQAERVLGAVEEWREKQGYRLSKNEQRRVDRCRALAPASPDAMYVARAESEGRASSIEAIALEVLLDVN